MSVLPTKDVDITPALLNKMTYLDQCLRETLRLFPTVPMIGRKPIKPIVLNNVEIPANVPVIVGIRQLHRRKEIWGEDALSFNPDHFDSGKDLRYKDIPGSYIPFSLGQRNCIGKIFCPFYLTQNLICIFWVNRLQLCYLHNEACFGTCAAQLSPHITPQNERPQNQSHAQLSYD